MKVLAIDPGYGRCGVAIVERDGVKNVLIYSECIETSAEEDFAERLQQVVRACERLVKAHAPDCIAMEKLFFAKNQKTAMRVAEVRGALLSLAGSTAIPVFEYSPGEVKSAAAGSGSADKTQVAKMLHALVKIDKVIRHDDEYDAIAIGVTHLARSRSASPRTDARV
ncbi:MAG: crossover junction endodeoxyribonuclease RuvC [Patescibacteria group bacterium]